MDCCKNELGVFPHNEDIKTGISTADGVGNYILYFTGINGTQFSITIAITDPITQPTLVIPKGLLNENMYYCFTVSGPKGTVKLNECEKFCLSTIIVVTPDCGDTCPPEEAPGNIAPGDGGNVIL